jgi:hypothetical protein
LYTLKIGGQVSPKLEKKGQYPLVHRCHPKP